MSKRHKKKSQQNFHSKQLGPQPEVEPARTKQDDFVDLYKADDPSAAVDMTTLERGHAKQRFFAMLLGVIALLSLVAAGLGYVVFGRGRLTVNPGDVTVTIDVPDQVASGDEVEITVTYFNGSATTLSKGALEVVLPNGFYLNSTNPEPAEDTENHWDVDGIVPGAGGTITLTGQLLGQVGDQKDITALLTYSPDNFSSDFQTSAHATMTVGESIMKLDVSAPDQVRSNEELTYAFKITNTAALPIVNAKAVLTLPSGFTVSSSDPSATQGNNVWLFPEIEAGATQEVKVKGIMSTDAAEEQEFVLQVGIQEGDGFLNLQAEDRRTVKVSNPELSLKLTGPSTAAAGDDVTYDISISNPSKTDIKDIVLKLEFSGGAIDGNSATLETIDSLAPGDEQELSYKAVVKDPLPSDAKDIQVKLLVDSAKIGEDDVEFTDTAEVTTSLQGTLELSAAGRYFSDDLSKIGSGPIPPKVGKTTTYVIRWAVTAGGGSMSDINITTTIPDGVSFADSGNDHISFDSSTSTVTYSLDSLPSGSTETASFSVAVTPTEADLNKLLVLTNEAIATATDDNSNESVQVQVKKITSNLTSDPGAEDDGVVVE
jgi:hypothetical protein